MTKQYKKWILKKKHLLLDRPPGFDDLSFDKMNEFEWGANGRLSGLVIPENIYGIDISAACAVHDFEYEQGICQKRADTRFYKNMEFLIKNSGENWFIKFLSNLRAKKYYIAVKMFGWTAFKKKG